MLSTAIGIVQQDDLNLRSAVSRLGYAFRFKPFPTTAQMLQSWRQGVLGGVITPFHTNTNTGLEMESKCR